MCNVHKTNQFTLQWLVQFFFGSNFLPIFITLFLDMWNFFLKTIFVKESVFLVKEIEAIFFFFFFLGCGNVLGIFHFCWNGLKWCHTIIVCNWKVFRFRIGSSSFHIIITHNLKLKADGTLLMLLSKVPSLIWITTVCGHESKIQFPSP